MFVLVVCWLCSIFLVQPLNMFPNHGVDNFFNIFFESLLKTIELDIKFGANLIPDLARPSRWVIWGLVLSAGGFGGFGLLSLGGARAITIGRHTVLRATRKALQQGNCGKKHTGPIRKRCRERMLLFNVAAGHGPLLNDLRQSGYGTWAKMATDIYMCIYIYTCIHI